MDIREPADYVIRVIGLASSQWCDWFEGLTVEAGCDEEGQPPVSILHLAQPDLAELHGVLVMIGNLNMTLLSVTRVEPKNKTW